MLIRCLPLLFLTACSSSMRLGGQGIQDAGPPYEAASLELVPAPLFVQSTSGHSFYLGRDTRIAWSEDFDGASRRVAGRLERYLEAGTGWDLAADMGPPADGAIHLAIDPSLASRFEGLATDLVPGETYRIEVAGKRLLVRGASERGLGAGLATLQQMLSPEFAKPEAWEHFKGTYIPFDSLVIEDAPRFRWRGVHLDVGRYLYAVEDIERLLDAMAFYKFNVFHWHLTEDQGWRIEIDAYPKLTEVGAWRKSTPVRGDRSSDDGAPYGGFYTKDEVRHVVAYAAALGIDVMPEIELPGHSTAAIAAYPELGNPEFTDGLEVGHRWGVHRNTLHPSDYTLGFYEQVFDEVFELFPFEFVHIGADEAPKQQWKNSPTTQARMAELGIETEDELQAWFVAHFERYLSDHGRRLVGWDEIQEGGLPAGATMMVWRGWNHGIEAAKKGHDIIMAPTSHTYLDYYQAGPTGEPEAIGGMLPLEKVYAFEPVPPELAASERHHVLGAQGQLWSEYFHDWDKVEYMAFPRLLALSEVVWSQPEARDWPGFQRRLLRQLEHMDARGIGYRVPEPEVAADLILFEGSTSFELPGLFGRSELDSDERHRMWFVLDDDGDFGPRPGLGTGDATPGPVGCDLGDPRLHRPLEISEACTLEVAIVRDRARVGPSVSVGFAPFVAASAEELAAMEPGLWLEALQFTGDGLIGSLPALADQTAGSTAAGGPLSAGWEPLYGPFSVQVPGVVLDGEAFDGAGGRGMTAAGDLVLRDVGSLAPLAGQDAIAARFHGYLQVDEPGLYRVTVTSDDGSRVLLADHTLVDNDGQHGRIARSATAQLPAGTFPFEVHWFDAGGAESLDLEVEGPGAWRLLRMAAD